MLATEQEACLRTMVHIDLEVVRHSPAPLPAHHEGTIVAIEGDVEPRSTLHAELSAELLHMLPYRPSTIGIDAYSSES